jgi:GTPase SAR1 family protein
VKKFKKKAFVCINESFRKFELSIVTNRNSKHKHGPICANNHGFSWSGKGNRVNDFKSHRSANLKSILFEIFKSTYCNIMSKHFEAIRRPVKFVNLDPAAEYFEYPLTADIRDLISVDDVMDDETLHLGPNGGLVFCMEYFSKNFNWLLEEIDADEDDDLILFDCPGQIELYTHLPIMRQFVEQLQKWNFNVCGVFIIDAQFLIDMTKYFSGILAALSVMITLEIPHVNVMSKIDLLGKKDKEELERSVKIQIMIIYSNMLILLKF